jgi:hypothetical protein
VVVADAAWSSQAANSGRSNTMALKAPSLEIDACMVGVLH